MSQCWHFCPHCKKDFFHEIEDRGKPLDEYERPCADCIATKFGGDVVALALRTNKAKDAKAAQHLTAGIGQPDEVGADAGLDEDGTTHTLAHKPGHREPQMSDLYERTESI